MVTFPVPLLPAPPAPPDNIVNEQDRQLHLQFSQWLIKQEIILKDQQNHYDTETKSLRKIKKVYKRLSIKICKDL